MRVVIFKKITEKTQCFITVRLELFEELFFFCFVNYDFSTFRLFFLLLILLFYSSDILYRFSFRFAFLTFLFTSYFSDNVPADLTLLFHPYFIHIFQLQDRWQHYFIIHLQSDLCIVDGLSSDSWLSFILFSYFFLLTNEIFICLQIKHPLFRKYSQYMNRRNGKESLQNIFALNCNIIFFSNGVHNSNSKRKKFNAKIF